MLYRKTGFPDEGELVFCTVTSVQYNSVFVRTEEYGKTGLIHISEISPGRIRNIRDYVKEGKVIVCKVIKIDEQKGHIDLSLRRVTEMQKRQKTDERKQEQKAEKILEILATQIKEKEGLPKLYNEISTPIMQKYEFLHHAFEDVVENGVHLKDIGVPIKYADKLEELVKEKIKPKAVIISGVLKIRNYDENGLEIVKNALKAALEAGSNVSIRYLGAGQYNVRIEAKIYKDAEGTLKEALDNAKKVVATVPDHEFSFKRKDRD